MFNYHPARKTQPPAEDTDDEPDDEAKLLWQWRWRAATDAGLSDPDACLFADAELDSHALTDLTGVGCDPATALRILLR